MPLEVFHHRRLPDHLDVHIVSPALVPEINEEDRGGSASSRHPFTESEPFPGMIGAARLPVFDRLKSSFSAAMPPSGSS